VRATLRHIRHGLANPALLCYTGGVRMIGGGAMRLQADELYEIQDHIFYSLPWVLEKDPRFVSVIEAIVTEKFPRREEVARLLDRLAEIRESLDRLEDRQETFQAGQDGLREDVTELRGDVTELRQGQVELREDVTELRGDVTELRGDVTGLRQDVTELRQGQVALRGDVTELRQGQVALRGDVTELRGDVTELRQGQAELRRDVTELRGDVTELRQGQVALCGDVTGLRGDVTELRQGQVALCGDVTGLRGDVAGLRQGQAALQSGLDRVDNRLLVLGNRWGVQNEAAVRNALRGLLAGLGYVVEKYEVLDAAGEVHGVPGPVEIDLVVRDGELWLVEIKGRVSGNDLFAFMRKARFYQAHTGRSATRRIVIAPVVEEPAQARATQEGIECYSAVDELRL
jgi:hypothetical protein